MNFSSLPTIDDNTKITVFNDDINLDLDLKHILGIELILAKDFVAPELKHSVKDYFVFYSGACESALHSFNNQTDLWLLSVNLNFILEELLSYRNQCLKLYLTISAPDLILELQGICHCTLPNNNGRKLSSQFTYLFTGIDVDRIAYQMYC